MTVPATVRTLFADVSTGRFWRHLLRATFAAVGLLAALIGLFDVLFPKRLDGDGTVVAICVGAGALLWGAAHSWPRPIKQEYNQPDTKIRVIRGDLLEQPDHLVIGTCTTFDTEPPDIISSKSLQGAALRELFDGDIRRLDRELIDALKPIKPTGTIAKPGKTDRYEIGTIATLRDGTRRLFWVAYTEMNQANEAKGTSDGIWKSLRALWAEASAKGNGQPISIPVVGGAQARMSQILPAQDSIRFIALSYMLASREARFCSELRIVVLPDAYDRLDRLELQAFLSSLAAS